MLRPTRGFESLRRDLGRDREALPMAVTDKAIGKAP